MEDFFKGLFKVVFFLGLILVFQNNIAAKDNHYAILDTNSFIQYKGSILDLKTRKDLAFASITVSATTISTISNSEGKFSIKIPNDFKNASLIISFLGYENKILPLTELKSDGNLVYLNPSNIILEEVVVKVRDAKNIFSEVLNKRIENYGDDQIQMTGFYRETIRKRRTYVSLSESVLEIQKQPFSASNLDKINLYKGRKSADYSKLDTLNFKLQGGPFSALYIDLVKYTDFIFSEEAFDFYDFTLDEISQINNQLVYVLAFKQKPTVVDPLYYGKIYVDANSLAIINASFQLNVEDRNKAGLLFTRKKPFGLDIYPTEVSYQIKYREQNGKWIYAYSRGDLSFKLNWDKKLFNTVYNTSFELAVTYWENQMKIQDIKKQNLRSNVIMSEKVSSMADPDFWGEYNIIEPEKSIETAIRKIQNLNLK
ncbi:MAG: hypothetical protein RIR51_749 [Bacteroidota bacterium]|jgi:hypothetical protein